MSSLSDVISSTMILVCLDGFGMLFFRTGSGVSRVAVSPTGVSDWYWMAVEDGKEGLEGMRIVWRGAVNDRHVDAQRMKHNAE